MEREDEEGEELEGEEEGEEEGEGLGQEECCWAGGGGRGGRRMTELCSPMADLSEAQRAGLWFRDYRERERARERARDTVTHKTQRDTHTYKRPPKQKQQQLFEDDPNLTVQTTANRGWKCIFSATFKKANESLYSVSGSEAESL